MNKLRNQDDEDRDENARLGQQQAKEEQRRQQTGWRENDESRNDKRKQKSDPDNEKSG